MAVCKYFHNLKKGEYNCEMENWEGSKKGYCIFHDPNNEKPPKLFFDTLSEQLNGNTPNSKNIFIGYVFPTDIEIFKNHTFTPQLNSGISLDAEDYLEDNPKDFSADFSQAKFLGNCNFRNAVFSSQVLFEGTVFNGITTFQRALFEDDVSFKGTVFKKKTNFALVEFKGMSIFENSRFYLETNFAHSVFDFVSFKNTDFMGKVDFQFAKFMQESFFDQCTLQKECNLFNSFFSKDTSFNNVQFKDKCNLTFSKFEGLIYCKKIEFMLNKNKEIMYRKARISWESEGERKEADFYYRNEMATRRKQLGPQKGLLETCKKFSLNELLDLRKIKNNIMFIAKETDWLGYLQLIKRFFEWLLVETTTSYGTRWFRVLGWWATIILGFAFYYTASQGLQVEGEVTFFKGLYFSMVSFTTLGFGDIIPLNGLPQIIAGIESLLGTIFIAVFVVVFGRKWVNYFLFVSNMVCG